MLCTVNTALTLYIRMDRDYTTFRYIRFERYVFRDVGMARRADNIPIFN